jgi:hypothetical protein
MLFAPLVGEDLTSKFSKPQKTAAAASFFLGHGDGSFALLAESSRKVIIRREAAEAVEAPEESEGEASEAEESSVGEASGGGATGGCLQP